MENRALKGLDILQSGQLQKLVVENLKRYILESKLAPGDPFPTEKELSDTLGVSRTVIREALKSLETLGVIEARHGVGRFLKEFDVEIFLNHFSYDLELNIRDFKDILEIRIGLESYFLAKCIPLYTADELDELSLRVEAMRQKVEQVPAVSEPDLIVTHTDFHLALYRRLGNPLLLGLIRIFSNLQKSLNLVNRYSTLDREDFVVLHDRLLYAIRNRDVALATRRLFEHFNEAVAWGQTITHEGDEQK